MKRFVTPARAAIAAALALGGVSLAQAQLSKALDTGAQATRRAEEVQRQINQLDDQRSDLAGEFRQLLQRKTAEELYLRQQEKLVESQREEIAAFEDQLGRVDEISSEMTPMMYDLITDLEKFVEADLPFRIVERRERIQQLKTLMERADISPTERYRQIITAYQAEMEYGRTISTYTDQIEVDGVMQTVDVFNYGRVALVYLTSDRKRAGRFDRETRTWEPLKGAYLEDILQATRVAREVAQQTVLFGPIKKFAVAN